MARSIAVPLLCFACLLASPAAAQDTLMEGAAAVQADPPPPKLPGNPATPAKVLLGKRLYFDLRLSASHVISCSSCHNIGLSGADSGPTSIGHRWQHGGRNARPF